MPKKPYPITTLSPLPAEIRLQILDDLDLMTYKSALAVFRSPTQSVVSSRADGQASLSEEERHSWWEGKLQDKRSSTARRLCLLGLGRELVFEDLFAIRACDRADRALGSLDFAKPPESWYPPEARYWTRPQSYYVFHGDVPVNIRFRVFIPQNPYEGVSAESVPKLWQQIFIAKLSKQCSMLSLPQPEPGSDMFNHFGSMFACISSKPVLCFEDVDPSVFLPIAAYRIQPLVILRLRDEKDCRETHWTGVLECSR
ncbi:hypothetical protein I350_05116 [Cryptococcus amylolentus CBS 6273]|uniref:Uncharacterized protein n=1 Tax=Cryptococcus amylolentus CBS 6273 TaxID=1296118 RepID=A0A1E3JX96_9TREE|nr:hypothetical protein I350_05116 [Cryptococcus amylolentus CBS 6273]